MDFLTRLPAEWEPQDGVLLAWPHAASDWQPLLERVEPVYCAVAREISRFERVLIALPPGEEITGKLRCAGANLENITLCPVPTNDTWARDFGPITVLRGHEPLLLDFGFNGWGLKFAADLDNQITRCLADAGLFRPPRRPVGLVLEGGSIESDGRGTILTTAACLLNPNRNPHLSRPELETALSELLGADRFLWLESGHLAGDDTDSHVDTLARLCPDDTILYVACDDPSDSHYPVLTAMAAELAALKTREGRPYRLIPLPWPEALFDDEGERLPATYANFLVINGAVLVPTYADKSDGAALAAVGRAFPDREVIAIDCRPLVLQHGSLHCVTMQLPQGVLR